MQDQGVPQLLSVNAFLSPLKIRIVSDRLSKLCDRLQVPQRNHRRGRSAHCETVQTWLNPASDVPESK